MMSGEGVYLLEILGCIIAAVLLWSLYYNNPRPKAHGWDQGVQDARVWLATKRPSQYEIRIAYERLHPLEDEYSQGYRAILWSQI